MLVLPLELREKIYRDVLASTPGNPRLLRTCREIYDESHKFLFQRPLVFRSQSNLHQWIGLVGTRHLRYVEEIHLTLTDIDLTPLLETINTSDPRYMPRLLVWELYEEEITRLYEALRQMPNTKTLTINASSTSQSLLFREFLGSFMEDLAAVFPSLHRLALRGNIQHQRLAFLSSMQQLQVLSFDGFSASSPLETISILRNLPSLSTLEVVSNDATLTPLPEPHNSSSYRQSLTASVIHQLNPLTSFSFKMFINNKSSTSPSFLYLTTLLDALHSNHSNSLKSLSLAIKNTTPDNLLLDSLQTFLNALSIQHLEYIWQNLDPEVLGSLLPASLRTLRISVANEEVAFDVLWVFIRMKEEGDVKDLEKVVLLFEESNREADGGSDVLVRREEGRLRVENQDTAADELGLAIRNLQYSGVVVLKGSVDCL